MRHTLWITALLAITAITLTLWSRVEDSAAPAPAVSTQSSGTAQIGGEFSLTDQHGKPFTSADLQGTHALIFFGFTHCPDICPTALLTISNTVQALGRDAGGVTPVFITVDPKRDTVERMRSYMAEFDSRIVALTGTEAQTAQAENAYKVYAQTVETPETDHYMVNHSGFLYLMDPDGNYLKHFAYNISQDELINALSAYITTP